MSRKSDGWCLGQKQKSTGTQAVMKAKRTENGKKSAAVKTHIITDDDAGLAMEQRFIAAYRKYGDNSARVLLSFYRGQYHRFLLSTLFYVIKHSPALFSSLLIANVINAALEGGASGRHKILVNVGIWLALLAVHLPANWLHTHLRSSVTRGTEAGLRSALVRKLQTLSIPYFTSTQSGRLQSKIIRDVEQVETLSSQLLVNLMNISISLFITLAITAVKNRVVLLFFLLVTPAASLTIFAFRRKIREENRRFRGEMEDTSAKVMEMVEMIPVARAHALEKEEIDKLNRQLRETSEQGYRLDMVQSNFGAVSWVIFQVFQALCLLFTGMLALRGRIPVGDVTFYQSSFTTVVNQVTSLINLIPILTKGLESVTSIGEVLISEDVEQNDGKMEMRSLQGEYRFAHVSYSYPGSDAAVLHDFNLYVKPGECLAIVGASGAGKTTILNLITGFLRPSGGVLSIDGVDITRLDLRTYRRFISVVPQTPLLFTGTIRENITYGMKQVSEEKVIEAVEAANLKSVIDDLPAGLDTMVTEHGSNFSGGQRQRIAIARAIIRDPQVIVLDEATSALDTIAEREVQEALNRLIHGRTTFIVAHRLSSVRQADEIIVMEHGTVIEKGNYRELMDRHGRFYEMETLQNSFR